MGILFSLLFLFKTKEMKLIKKIIIVFVFLFSVLVNAQNEKTPSYFSNELELNKTELINGTSINYHVRLQEAISTISLKQIGNENIANVENRLAQGEHEVYQIGNNNNYQFLNYRNNISVNLGVLQIGNANSLKVVGVNSMSKDLKIVQFGGVKMSVINY